jgi:hypothetical protein
VPITKGASVARDRETSKLIKRPAMWFRSFRDKLSRKANYHRGAREGEGEFRRKFSESRHCPDHGLERSQLAGTRLIAARRALVTDYPFSLIGTFRRI